MKKLINSIRVVLIKKIDKYVIFFKTQDIKNKRVKITSKFVLTLFFAIVIDILSSISCYSKNYYISSSLGNDSYTSVQVQNQNTPWRTIDKLNSSMNVFNPGDSILFKRGDTFIGTIILTKSGTSGSKIIFGAYGYGNSPIVSGLIQVNSWSNYLKNVWVSNISQIDTTISVLLVNGKMKQIGRYPNAQTNNNGYLTISSHTSDNQLTSDSLNSLSNWVGGSAVIRTQRYVIEQVSIVSQNNKTLTFNSALTNHITNGYGFFITNNINTLDQEGEWYFDKVNKKIYLFSKVDPNTLKVEVSHMMSTFIANNQSYFDVCDIDFVGSASTNIDITGSANVVVKNCKIASSGLNALVINNGQFITLSNNTIIDVNDVGIWADGVQNVTIEKNNIKRIGLMPGIRIPYKLHGISISSYISSPSNLIQYNNIDSVGYNGIMINSNGILVQNNYISNFCMIKDDGGGIYLNSYGLTPIVSDYKNRIIKNNIIINGKGSPEGTNSLKWKAAEGIYVDDQGNYIIITDNTVSNCDNGIKIHNSNKIILRNNTIFNNNNQLLCAHDALFTDWPITKCEIKKNIFFSKNSSQPIITCNTLNNDISNFGVIDSNYYYRPTKEDAPIEFSISNLYDGFIDFPAWQNLYKFDFHSKKSPYSISEFIVRDTVGSNKFGSNISTTFNSNISGWVGMSSSGTSTITWDNNKLDGGSLKMGFKAPFNSKKDGRMYVGANIGSVTAGKNYLLKFISNGDSIGQTFYATLSRDGGDYASLCPAQYLTISSKRKEYTMLFTPTISESNARISFWVREYAGNIWFDNVIFKEVNVEVTDLNDYIKLLYNPTQSPVTYSFNKQFRDISDNRYTKIILQPYTSIILMLDTTKFRNQANINSFEIKDMLSNTKIDSIKNIINVVIPFGKSLSSLVAVFSISSNATIKIGSVIQVSGNTPNDFNDTVIYKITAQDGLTIKNWKVIIKNAPEGILVERNQIISLKAGWNIVSFNVIPSNPDLSSIFQPMIKTNNLIKIQDEKGNFMLNTDFGWYSNLDTLDVREGYNVKVNADAQLIVHGTPVPNNIDIPLKTGFNIIGYPLTKSHEALSSFQSLTSQGALIKVQDETGKFLLKNGSSWYSNIDSLKPGKGYYVNLKQDANLNFGALKSKSIAFENEKAQSDGYFQKTFSGNPYSSMNFVIRNLSTCDLNLKSEDEIGIFDGNSCVGKIIYNGSNIVGLSAGMQDQRSQISGFTPGDTIKFQIWRTGEQMLVKNITAVYLNSTSNLFVSQGTAIVALQTQLTTMNPLISQDLVEIKNYPNPFIESTTFEFSLIENRKVSIEIYDLQGRMITEIINQDYEAGKHTVIWNGTIPNGQLLQPGIYIYSFKAGNYKISKKIMLRN